jgi:hypothetical protein
LAEVEGEENLKRAAERTRIAKIIASYKTFLIAFPLLFIEQCVLSILYFYYYAVYITPPTWVVILGYINGIAHGAVFFVLMFIVFLVDLIFDIKKFGACSGYYQRDPLNYRVDFVFITLVLVNVIIFSILNLVSYSYATDAINTVFGFLFRLCMILAAGLSCHIVILKRFITNIITSTNADQATMSRTDVMLRVLNNAKGKETFEAYCNSELSIENFKVYFDLKAYQEISERDKKEYMCRVIYYKYVQPNAFMEVNMPNTTRVKIKSAFDNLANENLDTIYDELLREALSNLTDTFGRFQVTEMYRKLKRRSSFSFGTELKLLESPTPTVITDSVFTPVPETPTSPLQTTHLISTPRTPRQTDENV